MVVKPKFFPALILCFALLTDLISPARLNSPKAAVFELTGKSVLAEYSATAIAASMELSLNLIPPATFT